MAYIDPEDTSLLHNHGYILGRLLGEGAFGNVHLATSMKTGDIYAIKIIRKLSQRDLWTTRKNAQEEEMKLLGQIDHPKIVKMVDNFASDYKFYMVMEYCAGSILLDTIYKQKGLSEDTARYIFQQILHAVSYLHSLDIIHRDIKSENIIYKEKSGNEVKLMDFGLSRIMSRSQLVMTNAGTLYYKAPEICLQQPYGKPCDCWSLGILLYEMLCGELPCNFWDDSSVISFAQRGVDFKHTKWVLISQEAKDLVSNLLVFKPEERYTCEQALKSSWITGIHA